MTGSVLDVCLALLLVSAAAVTLVGADTESAGRGGTVEAGTRAEETAAVLTATTAAVNYTLGDVRARSGAPARPDARRVAHGTLAGHLARAAVRSATIDGTPLSPEAADYRRSVRAAVADAVGGRTEIVAVWQPLPGSGLAGEVRVGPSSPETASVSAVRFTIPVPGAPTAVPATAPVHAAGTGDGERGGVARDRVDAAAASAVAVLFPPERIAAASRDDPPVPELVAWRYRRAGGTLGVDAAGVYRGGSPRDANRLLADALATRVDGGSASGAAAPGGPVARARTVEVVVRTWSR